MEDSEKRVESHNITKNISEKIIIPLIEEINSYLRNADIGEKDSPFSITNSRIRNLRFAYNAMERLINNIISDVEMFQKQQWSKKNRKKEDREKNPYENEETDTKRLIEIREDLAKRAEEIELSAITETKEDDFKKIYQNQFTNEKEYFVNERFYIYKRKAADYYIEIMYIMGENGIKMYRKEEDNWMKSIEEEEEEGFLS